MAVTSRDAGNNPGASLQISSNLQGNRLMASNVTPSTTLCLFKETRISNEAAAGRIIRIGVPSTGITAPFSRNSGRRLVFNNIPKFKDEDSFATNLLASSGSIHFGSTKRYPRNIVWRVLGGKNILELRSADLSKNDREAREATCVIQLVFNNILRDGAVALADSEDQDLLCLFVIPKGSDLYTFTIRRDFFCRPSASEEDVHNWCKISKPASFSIGTPYRLIAGSSRQLIVSLSDGKLLHLTRRPEDDGSLWHERTYSDGQWGASLRGLVRWQGSNTVRYDGTVLEQDTPTALAVSPDKAHALIVSLNHTLKVWNLSLPRSVFSNDLLGQKREPLDIPKLMLDPSISHKLQIFRDESNTTGDLYYVFTFSPHDLGQFKIWAVRDADHGALGVRDMFPELTLRPPDPDPSPDSKAIWKVADFKVSSAGNGRGPEIWILMKSNKHYRLYKLKFEIQNLANDWTENWSMTVLENLDQHLEPQVSSGGPEDAREIWLRYFLQPGRYPEAVLETALSMYSVSRKLEHPTKAKVSLRERMCSLVASNVQLSQDEAGETDFKKFHADIHHEWMIFWQDVRDLNNSRWEVLSLAYDEMGNMPWLVFADGYAAIRDCSKIEVLVHNRPAEFSGSLHLLETPSIELDDPDREPKLPDELAVVIEAASAFRQSFNYSLRRSFSTVLATELWRDPSHSIPVRMQFFYDRCNFAEEIPEISVIDLEAGLKPIDFYNGLDTNSFLAIINEITQLMSTDASDLSSSKFGLKVLIEGARGMIDLHEQLLLDLLAMVVFINADIDIREQYSMEKFDGIPIYVELLKLLRECQMMQWLAKSVRVEKDDARAERETADLTSGLSPSTANVSTILESLFAPDTKPQAYSQQSQCTALTHSIQDILKWAMGGNDPTITLDRVLVYVQCNLLANDNIELALDFLRYQPSTAWATYIKGRLYLLRREFDEAAIYFKKAAYKLSCHAPGFDYHSASHGFLSPLEAAHLGHGLPSYYAHLLNLFESAQCHSYVATFAHISLQLISPSKRDQITPLLVSLFQASLSCNNFSAAYSALTRHPDPASLVPSLITHMVSNGETAQFLSFPFPPTLHSTIEAFLLKRARSTPLEPTSPSESRPKYYEILSSWRLDHNDFRGAAAALLERLQRLQKLSTKASSSRLTTTERGGGGGGDDALLQGYLSVINLLASIPGPGDDGWVLSGGDDSDGLGGEGRKKRKLVTIQDVRKEYQDELDRRSMIENGRFGFGYADDSGGGEGDEMDIVL